MTTALRAYAMLLDTDADLPVERAPNGEVVTMLEISTDELHALARLATREGDRALDREEPEAAKDLQILVHRLLRYEERGLAEVATSWCRAHGTMDLCPEHCPRCNGYFHGDTDCRYAAATDGGRPMPQYR